MYWILLHDGHDVKTMYTESRETVSTFFWSKVQNEFSFISVFARSFAIGIDT